MTRDPQRLSHHIRTGLGHFGNTFATLTLDAFPKCRVAVADLSEGRLGMDHLSLLFQLGEVDVALWVPASTSPAPLGAFKRRLGGRNDVQVADANGDQPPRPCRRSFHSLTLLLGDGVGGFAALTTCPTEAPSLLVADATRGHLAGLASPPTKGSTDVSVLLLASGNGTLRAKRPPMVWDARPDALGDIDDDDDSVRDLGDVDGCRGGGGEAASVRLSARREEGTEGVAGVVRAGHTRGRGERRWARSPRRLPDGVEDGPAEKVDQMELADGSEREKQRKRNEDGLWSTVAHFGPTSAVSADSEVAPFSEPCTATV